MKPDPARRTLGDYVTLVRGTTYDGRLVGAPGPALLGLGSIEPGGGFRDGHFKTFGGDCPSKLMLHPGDIYVALKGATKDGSMIGSAARVPPTVPTGRLTQDTVKLVFHKQSEETAQYVYWLLRTPQARENYAGHLRGTAAASLSRDDFLALPVPPLTPTRRKLVDLLELIDAKLRLLREMSEPLEEMARALFKSWFVDFDPVRAKAERRDTGLPKRIARLFPDSLVDSPGGEVPSGWRSASLADVCSLNPESWSKHTRPDSIRYVDLSGTKWGRILEVATFLAGNAPSRAQRILRLGDCILGTVRPGNGSYALVSEEGLTGSTGFAVLRPRDSDYVEFAYLAATAAENVERLSHLADGGAYPAVRPELVAATQAVIPSGPVIAAFSAIVAPLMSRIAAAERESSTLAALRDALLPKLLSGELRVSGCTTDRSEEMAHG